MKSYYKGIIIGAAIFGSVVGEGEKDKLGTHNLLFASLPSSIHYELAGPIAATSGALASDLLLLTVLEKYTRRKEE